ncbi:cupin domain-containing protein [Campylobacter jejuni]|nr:cupin domain-containing protein [Campylobacter jejuni]
MQELEKAGIHGSFKGDSKFFSKNVKVSMMFKSNEWRNFSGALVEFEASARSAWHTHPQGQTLIVTEGEIITKVPGQKEGKNVEWLELVSDEEYENALKEARE